jgi:hypothetical protein
MRTKKMTYKELAEKILNTFNDDQLYYDVTIHLGSNDEYYKIDDLALTNDEEEDRLDDGHPILVVLD